jgi:hypothetical protein
MDDSKLLAQSILGMYGEGAEKVALGYAQKHQRAGDVENHTVWAQVIEYLTKRQNELTH